MRKFCRLLVAAVEKQSMYIIYTISREIMLASMLLP